MNQHKTPHPYRRWMPPSEIEAAKAEAERKRAEAQDRNARYARGGEALNRHFNR